MNPVSGKSTRTMTSKGELQNIFKKESLFFITVNIHA